MGIHRRDTTTLLGQLYELKFSITKEVLNDTLMPNGKIYKKIKWENVANNVSYLPWYEYHRVDSTGNVFLYYYNNQDYLLFDFSLSIGQTYSSHTPNHIRKISDKYNVIGFGDTVQAIDFQLLENGTLLKEKYTVAENFGIIYYQKNIPDYIVPEGNFWGAVLNGVEYGTMIVKKQTVDWSEFYPLHIGDFWKYEGNDGIFQTFTYIDIVKDTIMSDGQIYKMIHTENYGGPYPGGEGRYFERLDSISSAVMGWNFSEDKPIRKYKFSTCLGDTFYGGSPNSYYRFDDKSYDVIHYSLYPDLVFVGYYFTKGLGLTERTIEGGGYYLVGAVIEGKVYGDTTTTNIDEEYNISNNFELYQNYPNPFNPTTSINYQIKEKGFVSLKIYDMLGKEVAYLLNETQESGQYSVVFNARNLSSGVYIYTLQANGYSASQKMLVLK